MYMPSDDLIRYIKASLGMKKVKSLAVRKIFDKYIPPNTLQLHLKKNKGLILKNPHFRKQISILYPDYGSSSSLDYDITLMTQLLRHHSMIKEPKNGFDKLPSENETSDGADLARIKSWRNILAHLPEGMTMDEFDEFIKEMKPVAERHAGRNLDKEFDEVKNGVLVVDLVCEFEKKTVYFIVIAGCVYVWYVKFVKNGYQFDIFILDVKRLNTNDRIRLIDWSCELHRIGHQTCPFPLNTKELSWRACDIEVMSNPLWFPLYMEENCDDIKHLVQCLCLLLKVPHKALGLTSLSACQDNKNKNTNEIKHDIQVEGTDDIKIEGTDDIQVEGTDGIKIEGTDDIKVEGTDDIEVEGTNDIEVEDVIPFSLSAVAAPFLVIRGMPGENINTYQYTHSSPRSYNRNELIGRELLHLPNRGQISTDYTNALMDRYVSDINLARSSYEVCLPRDTTTTSSSLIALNSYALIGNPHPIAFQSSGTMTSTSTSLTQISTETSTCVCL